jgi:glutathione S-transferase
MRLYDFALAPSPRKVRLFMAEKGLEIPVVSVNLRALEQRDASFSAKNPDATVPAATSPNRSRSAIIWKRCFPSRIYSATIPPSAPPC